MKTFEHLYEHFYEDSFFVRLVDGSPDINWVKNTNFCDIAVHSNGKQIVVFSAIDNLVKGAAGQAVQNMNLMFGLDETTGLSSREVIHNRYDTLPRSEELEDTVPARDL